MSRRYKTSFFNCYESYGLHRPHGTYPILIASPLLPSGTLFASAISATESQSGLWNFIVFLLPIYATWIVESSIAATDRTVPSLWKEMETARRLFLNVRHFKDLPALAETLEAMKNKDSNVKPALETDNLEESLEKGDIIGTIAEYCVDQMPSVVNRTHVDSKTVLRIMFLSNCLRWKCRKIVRSDRFPEWWKNHISEIGKALGLWEGLVVLVLRAELEALLEDADDQD